MSTLASPSTTALRGLTWWSLAALVLVALVSLACKAVSLVASVLVLVTDAAGAAADSRVGAILAGTTLATAGTGADR